MDGRRSLLIIPGHNRVRLSYRSLNLRDRDYELLCQLLDLHLLFGDVENEQITQFVIGRNGSDLKQAVIRLAADLILNRAQTRNIAEQLLDGIAQLQLGQWANVDVQHACTFGWLRADHDAGRCDLSGNRNWHRRYNNRSCLRFISNGCSTINLWNLRQTLGQCFNAHHQFGSGYRLALITRLVTCQQAAAGVCRLQQHINHGGNGRDFMATQAVQQGLHAVRQLRHVREAKGCRAALDGVGAAKNAVELFVIGGRQIQAEQHLLHLVEVLAGLLEKDLIELAKVKVRARTCAILVCIRHGVSCCDSLLSA